MSDIESNMARSQKEMREQHLTNLSIQGQVERLEAKVAVLEMAVVEERIESLEKSEVNLNEQTKILGDMIKDLRKMNDLLYERLIALEERVLGKDE